MIWWVPAFVSWGCETVAIGSFLAVIGAQMELTVFVCVRIIELVAAFIAILRHVALLAREGKLDVELRKDFGLWAFALMWTSALSTVTLVCLSSRDWAADLAIICVPIHCIKLGLCATFARSKLVGTPIVYNAWYHYLMNVQEPFPEWEASQHCGREVRPQPAVRIEFEIPDPIWARIMLMMGDALPPDPAPAPPAGAPQPPVEGFQALPTEDPLEGQLPQEA